MSELRNRSNPHRLYRDKNHAMIAGVCAGLANYLGLNTRGLRLVVAASAIFFLPFVVVSYIVLAVLLPTQEKKPSMDKDKEDFWRDVSNAPSDVFSSLRHRCRELDLRLQRMEAFVTSVEFEIDKELGAGKSPS